MRLRTFGGLELEGSTFTRAKPLLLATYLSVEGPQVRRFLAELFWPHARDHMKSLTVALARLRKGAPGAVEADDVRAWALVQSDAARFLELLETGSSDEALALYQGPFLEGRYARTLGPELEEWVHETREFFAGHARRALLAEAEREAARKRFVEAASRAERAYRLSGTAPLEPETLARCHTLLLAGESPRATAVGEELATFGIAPVASSEAAKDHLRETSGVAAPPVPHNLPIRTTPFVGRDVELTEVAALLSRADGRLVTLVGTAGVGKTDLALQTAQEQLKLGAFPDGVYAVSLESLSSEAFIPSAIAEALDLRLDGDAEPLERVRAHVGQREMLVVLDNFEHLVEGAAMLTELLAGCPNLRLLVTSRERLHVKQERVFPIAGLPFPANDDVTPREASHFAAIRLFVQRAKRVRPDFALSEDTLPGVLAICRMVDGLPLGLELAAVWVRVMPVAEIAEQAAKDLDTLTTRVRDVPERHRSLRNAFEHSWTSLGTHERDVLRKLSVFRGGFRRDAAGDVTGATIPVLASLVDKSLLRVDPTGRYDRHPLLHQYTQEKMEEAEDAARVEARHQAYFVDLLQTMHRRLREGDQARALASIESELENVRAAWLRMIAKGDFDALDRIIDPLRVFFDMRKRFREGVRLIEQALSRLPASSERHQNVRGRLLVACAWLTHQTGDFEAAEQLAAEASRALRDGAEPAETAKSHNMLATMHWRVGDYAEAKAHWESALELADAHDHDDRGSYLANLALAEHSLGAYEEASEHLRSALAFFRDKDDAFHVIRTSNKLGVLLLDMGDLSSAEKRLTEGLEIARARGLHEAIPQLLVNLGIVAFEREDYAESGELSRDALERIAPGDDRYLEAYALARLGKVHAALGEEARAEACFARALSAGRKMTEVLVEAVHGVAELRLVQGRSADAVRALSLLVDHPATEPAVRTRLRRLLERARRTLPTPRADEAARRGDAMTLDELADMILRETASPS